MKSVFRLKASVIKILSILLLSFSLLGCADLSGEKELSSDDIRHSLPSQEFKDAVITQTNEGVVSFTLRSPVLKQYERKRKAILKGGIEVDFYKNGEVSSYLTADSGEVLNDGHELKAAGNVVVHTDSGMVIYTPRLHWTEHDGMIQSDTTVTIITEWDTLQGTGLIATQDLKFRRILNPVGVSRRKKISAGSKSVITKESNSDSTGLLSDSSVFQASQEKE